MNHHLAIVIKSPAFHVPCAHDSTRVELNHRCQIPLPLPHYHTPRISQTNTARLQPPPSTPSQQTFQPSQKHPLIAAHTNQVNNIFVANRQQITNASHTQRTTPIAMDATPLLNPTTETGVSRCVVVPSPSCREQRRQQQQALLNRLFAKNKQTLNYST